MADPLNTAAIRDRYFGDETHRYFTGPVPRRDIQALLDEVERLRAERDKTRAVMCQTKRGEWGAAIPLAYHLAFGRRRCACGHIFRSDEAYRGHYAYAHILGL